MELQGKKINFLGDSITFGHGVADKKDIFVQILKNELGLKAANNYGVSGTRIASQLDDSLYPDYTDNFRLRAARMDQSADIVIVFGGTNDFGHGDAPLGEFEDRTEWTFYGACHLLMLQLINSYPESDIIFITPLHRIDEDNSRGDGRKEKEGAVLIDYVNAIRRTAEFYSIPVLDLYANSGIQPRVEIIREKYMPDGLHPNEAGHAKLASLIASYLKAK